MINRLQLKNSRTLTTTKFPARLKQADLVTQTDFDDKLKHFNEKINSDKTRHLLVENEINKTLKNYQNLYSSIMLV